MLEIPGGIPSRGRSMDKTTSRERGGSPEPPRDAIDDLLDELSRDVEEEDDEDFAKAQAQLEGFEVDGACVSEATGFYYANRRAAKLPKDVKLELIDMSEPGKDNLVFKSCTVEQSQLAPAVDAMLAPEQFEDDVKSNPPIGSWHLYVDHYAFVDDERRAEYRFSCVPGDGLSTCATRSRFQSDAIHITCQLIDHPKAGPRSWTFVCRTPEPILPDLCSVKVYPSKKRVRVIVTKADPGLWSTAGLIYAPITKNNYRDLQRARQIKLSPPVPERDFDLLPHV